MKSSSIPAVFFVAVSILSNRILAATSESASIEPATGVANVNLRDPETVKRLIVGEWKRSDSRTTFTFNANGVFIDNRTSGTWEVKPNGHIQCVWHGYSSDVEMTKNDSMNLSYRGADGSSGTIGCSRLPVNGPTVEAKSIQVVEVKNGSKPQKVTDAKDVVKDEAAAIKKTVALAESAKDSPAAAPSNPIHAVAKKKRERIEDIQKNDRIVLAGKKVVFAVDRIDAEKGIVYAIGNNGKEMEWEKDAKGELTGKKKAKIYLVKFESIADVLSKEDADAKIEEWAQEHEEEIAAVKEKNKKLMRADARPARDEVVLRPVTKFPDWKGLWVVCPVCEGGGFSRSAARLNTQDAMVLMGGTGNGRVKNLGHVKNYCECCGGTGHVPDFKE